MSAAADRSTDSAPENASREGAQPSAREASAPAPSAGSEPLFREHLLPGPGMWIVAVAVGFALGLILVPLNLIAAIVVGVVAIAVLLVLVVLYSPVLEVSGGEFRLGRARIQVGLLGEPEVLRDEEWKRAIGQDFEPLAHHCVRDWTRSGLRVEVLDEEDPTTSWVASTRRPEDLALALRTAQQQARTAAR